MVLAGVEVFILVGGVVEYLELGHGVVGGITFSGVADGKAVITAGGEFEFKADGEVGVFFFGEEVAAVAVFADDGAVAHFIVIGGACPTGEVFAIEHGSEACGFVVTAEHGVCFFSGDFTDVDVAPADFAAVGL